jgi:hypothetical protein
MANPTGVPSANAGPNSKQAAKIVGNDAAGENGPRS